MLDSCQPGSLSLRRPSISSARARLFANSRLPTELLAEVIIETIFASLESLSRDAMAQCVRGGTAATQDDVSQATDQTQVKWEENVIRNMASVSFCFREIVAGIAVKSFGSQLVSSSEEHVLHAHICYYRLARHIVLTCEGSFGSILPTECRIKGGFVDVYTLYWISSWMHTTSLPQQVSAEKPDPDSDMSVYRGSRQRAGKWALQQLEAAAKMGKKGRMQPGFAARLLDGLEREREKVELFDRVWKARWEVDEVVQRLSSAGADDDEQKGKLKALKALLDELETRLRRYEPWMKRLFETEREVLESDLRCALDGVRSIRQNPKVSESSLPDYESRWKVAGISSAFLADG